MAFSALVMLLLVLSGGIMLTDKTRTLRPFDRATTDPLRAILALSIVAHHLSQKIDVPYFSSFFIPTGMPIVALFFLLSGYGLCVSFKKKGKDYLNGFLSKRYSKILPPFIALTCLMVILAPVLGKSISGQLLQIVHEGKTPLPNSWFIYAIIYTYASFYISALIGKTLRRTGLLLIGFNLIYIFLTSVVGHWGIYWYASIPAVNIGYYIALYEDRIDRLVTNHTFALYSFAVLMVFASFCAQAKMHTWTSTPYCIWGSFWALSIATAGYLIIRTLGTIKWKPLAWLSAISMEIYLIHGLPIKYLKCKIVSTYITGGNDLAYIILVYTLSIFLAWLIHKLTAKLQFAHNNKS